MNDYGAPTLDLVLLSEKHREGCTPEVLFQLGINGSMWYFWDSNFIFHGLWPRAEAESRLAAYLARKQASTAL